MTVNGIDLNRDGISDVLQQPLVGIRRLYGGPVSYVSVLTTPDHHRIRLFFVCVWNGGADAAVSLVSVDALGTRTLCGLASWSLGPRPWCSSVLRLASIDESESESESESLCLSPCVCLRVMMCCVGVVWCRVVALLVCVRVNVVWSWCGVCGVCVGGVVCLVCVCGVAR